jgi:16S rRNA (cytosine967-C5)-methyltransferase
MVSVRKLAFDLLTEWQNSNAHVDVLLAGVDARHELAPSDRALLHALVLGVLRHASLLDHWIDDLRGRGRLRDDPRWLLRIGLVQIFQLGIAPHAAVNETVRAASARERPLINAILRRALREKERLLAVAAEVPPAIRYSLPPFLVDRWINRFGVQGFERLATVLNQPAPIFVRLNRLKRGVAAPPEGEAVIDSPDFFLVQSLPRDWLERGDVYVQDPATGLAPSLLAPKPGESILDACAAPGGKTAMLAQMMQNRGQILATDHNESRLIRLRENLARLGVTCAEVRCADWATPEPGRGCEFDAILLDVPCSNTGVMRRRVDVRWRITARMIRDLAEMQFSLVKNTATWLKPGGRLVYSTCSIEPEENEKQVERIQQELPNLRLFDSRLLLPHETGFDGAFSALFRAACSEAKHPPCPEATGLPHQSATRRCRKSASR